MKTQARYVLFHAYIYISIAIVSLYTLIFALNKYWPATIYQAIFLSPFLVAPYFFRKGLHIFSKCLTILSSCLIVLLQTNYVFTKATGFHFQLIALIVVSFLICDLKKRTEAYLAIGFALFISICFFIGENLQFSSPLLILTELQNQFFHQMSLVTTLLSLSWLLYYYSKILANKEKELFRLANFDGLTNIHNRGYFMREGEKVYYNAKQKEQVVSAILFDIDDFKRINDEHGHPIGDIVLIRLSQKVSALLSPDIIFSRYGGEEFALLLPGKSINEAYVLGENIRKAIEKLTFEESNHSIKCTISIGIATAKNNSNNFDELLITADNALYRAKRSGKNTTVM